MRTTTLSPTRTGSSLRMILLLSLGSWLGLFLVVQGGLFVAGIVGGAL